MRFARLFARFDSGAWVFGGRTGIDRFKRETDQTAFEGEIECVRMWPRDQIERAETNKIYCADGAGEVLPREYKLFSGHHRIAELDHFFLPALFLSAPNGGGNDFSVIFSERFFIDSVWFGWTPQQEPKSSMGDTLCSLRANQIYYLITQLWSQIIQHTRFQCEYSFRHLQRANNLWEYSKNIRSRCGGATKRESERGKKTVSSAQEKQLPIFHIWV